MCVAKLRFEFRFFKICCILTITQKMEAVDFSSS